MLGNDCLTNASHMYVCCCWERGLGGWPAPPGVQAAGVSRSIALTLILLAPLCRKQALKAAAAAGQMQPVMPEDSGVASPIDEAEIRTEAMSVGLVAADRLASLLLYNAEVGPRPGLKVGSPHSTARVPVNGVRMTLNVDHSVLDKLTRKQCFGSASK